jgi:hypothetical protein
MIIQDLTPFCTCGALAHRAALWAWHACGWNWLMGKSRKTSGTLSPYWGAMGMRVGSTSPSIAPLLCLGVTFVVIFFNKGGRHDRGEHYLGCGG